MPISPPLAVSVVEAARLLGISRAGLYNAINRGDVRVVKLGGRTLVPVVEVERIIDGGAQ